MADSPSRVNDDSADDLLRRALGAPEETTAVALRVGGLPVSESVTVVFCGRRDLASIQTYVAPGRHGSGSTLSADTLLRVPCDLDLGDAEDREAAERLYAEQASVLRDVLVGADTVLDVWREPLTEIAGAPVQVDGRPQLDLDLPAHRLLPTALVAPDRGIVVTPVCGARALAQGRPPAGIACVQQEVARIYPLIDDPAACLEDFLARAAEHAQRLGADLDRRAASMRHFLELSDDAEETA